MSRYDYESGDYPAHWWQIDLERALTSGRGQRLLREVLAALIAMPRWELIEAEIVEVTTDDDDQVVDGAVCAVGAYAAYCIRQGGWTWTEALSQLAEDGWRGGDSYDTQRLGQKYGLARTVAYELGWLNDEAYARLSPSERWHAVFGWVWGQIRVERMPLAAAGLSPNFHKESGSGG